jgi:hypothetical protein
MFNSKIYFSLIMLSFMFSVNFASAAVYDLGNFKTASPKSTVLLSSFSDDEFISSNTADFGFSPVSQLQHSVITDNHVNIKTESQLRRDERHKVVWTRRPDKYSPIASPVPEPETYAMILAGLVLIGLSVHRRKREP